MKVLGSFILRNIGLKAISVAVGRMLLVLGFALPMVSFAGACPKLLMFDGTDIRSQTTETAAVYWGKVVGVDGFFLNNVMGVWQTDVGMDPDGKVWQRAKRFQQLYSANGASKNFVKVAIWKPHDWNNVAANEAVAANFGHVAALSRYAGFKGVALDLEPYVPIWGGSAGGPELTAVVYKEGRAIGRSMHKAYPGMTLILLQDALYWAGKGQGYHGGYSLAIPFLGGLLSSRFDKVVFASERSYDGEHVAQIVQDVRDEYVAFDAQGRLHLGMIMVAPGLWPLGKSYTDKSARWTPAEFASKLRLANRASDGYVWIYGSGSAWQTDGPYGKGPVTPNFQQFLDVLHRARRTCEQGG